MTVRFNCGSLVGGPTESTFDRINVSRVQISVTRPYGNLLYIFNIYCEYVYVKLRRMRVLFRLVCVVLLEIVVCVGGWELKVLWWFFQIVLLVFSEMFG